MSEPAKHVLGEGEMKPWKKNLRDKKIDAVLAKHGLKYVRGRGLIKTKKKPKR